MCDYGCTAAEHEGLIATAESTIEYVVTCLRRVSVQGQSLMEVVAQKRQSPRITKRDRLAGSVQHHRACNR